MEDKKHPETFTLYQIVVQLHGKKPDEDITSQKERSLLDNLIPVVSSYPFCHLRVWYKSISNEEVEGLGRMIKEFYDENISFQELYRDEKVSYQNKAFNIAKAVVVGRDDWLAFLTYDPPRRVVHLYPHSKQQPALVVLSPEPAADGQARWAARSYCTRFFTVR